jgi:acetylornithine deacetylase/succinyl-diaminopimelate desuccinylase-like protein
VTRKVTIRLRPENLRDNPALLELVKAQLNRSCSVQESVEVTIDGSAPTEFEPDPVATDRAHDAAQQALDENRQRAAEQLTKRGKPTSMPPTSEAMVEHVERETDRALGNLARRGVGIVARIVEFAVKVGGPLVG